MSNSSEIASYYQVTKEDREFCKWIRLLLNFGLGGAICCFGLVANFVSYFILNKGRSSGPVATFLLRALALTDNLFLLSCFVAFSIRDLFRYINYNPMVWRYIRVYTFPMIYIGQSATVWMTVIIAVTRYAAVCMPYIAKRICTMFNVQLAVGGLYFLVVIYNLPRFFENKIENRNGTIWIVGTWLGDNKKYQQIYSEVMYYIFSFALPLLLLIVLNFRLTAAYRAVERRRQRLRGASSRNQQDDTNITLVMIVVVAVFVVCQGPGRLAQIIWQYHYGSCRTIPFFIMELSIILEVLNSSVNFLIYFVIRAQFRTHLATALCKQTSVVSQHSVSPTSNSVMLQVQSGDIEQKTDMTSCSADCIKASNGKERINGKEKQDEKEECQMPFLEKMENKTVPESNV